MGITTKAYADTPTPPPPSPTPTCAPFHSCVGNPNNPTPTGTWSPLYNLTTTPEATQNWACPVGTPAGWGTVTPSWGWNAWCGQCAAQAVGNATSIAQTPTAVPPTPGPTETPHPPVNAEYLQMFDGGGPDWSYVGPDIPWNSLPAVTGGFGNPAPSLQYGLYESPPPGSVANSVAAAYGLFLLPTECNLVSVSFDYWYHDVGETGHFTGISVYDDALTRYDLNVNTSASPDTWHTISWSGTQLDMHFLQVYSDAIYGYNGASAYIDNVDFSCNDLLWVPTPTVTPTIDPSYQPTAVSQCEAVEDYTSSGVAASSMLFSMPQVMIGPKQCFGFDGAHISDDVLGLGPLDIPYIHICAYPVSLGSLTFMGFVLSVDLIFDLMAAAMLFRWLLGS